MAHQRILDVVLVRFFPEAQEVEVVRVLQRFHRQLRVRSGEVGAEVGEGSALSQVQLALDLRLERRPRPAVLDCLRRVPFPCAGFADLRQKHHDVKPGQLVSRLLTNCYARDRAPRKHSCI